MAAQNIILLLAFAGKHFDLKIQYIFFLDKKITLRKEKIRRRRRRR
jgi:hypothetical protein